MFNRELEAHFETEEASSTEKRRRLLLNYGTPAEALIYANLFSPAFVEVNGSVILAENVRNAAEVFKARRAESQFSLEEYEASFNFVEVAYLFAPGELINDAIEVELAHIMADSWRAKLKLLYPNRTFRVSVFSASETGSVAGIEFYEVR